MDDFWKYLIVANNIAMVWIIYTTIKNSDSTLLKRIKRLEERAEKLHKYVLDSSKVDNEIMKMFRLSLSNQSTQIGILIEEVFSSNPEQSENVDVKDS